MRQATRPSSRRRHEDMEGSGKLHRRTRPRSRERGYRCLLITSRQIKDFTIQNKDLRKGAVDGRVVENGSLQPGDLSLGALNVGGLIGGSLSSFGVDAAGNDPSSVYLPVLPADGGSELATPADANRSRPVKWLRFRSAILAPHAI